MGESPQPPQKKPIKKNRPSKKATGKTITKKALKQSSGTGSESFPVIGIGASAGGLDAFEKFFTNLPLDSGMAFVIVQHLDPTHESILSDLLRKFTQMRVMQVEEYTPVQPNRVYVIPPNTEMTLREGALHLAEPSKPRGLRLPIDHFFRSMATDLAEKAICIILSGTGTDGTLGLKAIKEEGGLAIVQTPDSARYDGMPVSAINTGLVDIVVAPEKIAAQLIEFVNYYFSSERHETRGIMPGISGKIERIFTMLKGHTGHDFSGYKENTIARRIERRMTVNQFTQVEDYLQYLRETPREIETLFRELLIGVTSFFRDPQAFEILEQKVLIPLFAFAKKNKRQIRVWVPGCSTGEEAYSVAMLLHEQLERSDQIMDIQIFATDIDQNAIAKAREGRYSANIAVDVSPERLKKFFTREKNNNMYQVKRKIRDTVVFAEQSVIKDPPFSKMNLICCRNLMIYLRPDVQQRLLSLFHYSLVQNGFLFLGNSETLGGAQKMFQTLDLKWKLFTRAEYVADMKTVIEFSGESEAKSDFPRLTHDRPISYRELTGQLLLADHVPTGILINEKGEMLYVHGNTGKFLEQGTGEVSANLMRLAREGLRMPLSTAVRNAVAQKKVQHIEGIQVRNDAGGLRVKLAVAPVLKNKSLQGLLLITLSEMQSVQQIDGSEQENTTDYSENQHVIELEQELKSTREYLQTVIEELETTNEELKSSNEELQSANEELQSTNEELQTSKEELQSINEELVTVNAELQARVEELIAANNDIKNLMESTQISTIFLDINLRIRRFTESSRQIVELIDEDIGRPLKNFVHKMRYPNMMEDIATVLETRKAKAAEVQSEDDNWYFLRIIPYRTTDEKVAGVVLTMTDINPVKEAEEALRKSEAAERARARDLETLLDAVPSIVWIAHDRECRKISGNKASNDFLRMSPDANPSKTAPPDQVPQHFRIFKDDTEIPPEELPVQLAARGEAISDYELVVEFSDGERYYLIGNASPIYDEQGNVRGAISAFRDITEHKLAEQALKESENRYRELFNNSIAGIILGSPDGEIYYANPAACSIVGYTEEELRKGGRSILFRTLDNRAVKLLKQREQTGRARGELTLTRSDGTAVEVDLMSVSFKTPEGLEQASIFFQDITERKQAEEELLQTRKLESVGVLAGGIAHDFNNLLAALSGNLELALETIDPTNEAHQYLDSAAYAIEKATGLTTQLLTFAKGGEPIKAVHDISEVLKDAATFSMHGSKSRLIMQIVPDLWLAEADSVQISQVVNNLIINARQAMPDGGTITLSAENVKSKEKPRLKISIRDEGVGIKPEDSGKIFDPYYTTKPGNSGLGLATVHSIIAKHDGSVTVASEQGKGTVFTILLPADPQTELPRLQDPKNKPPDQPVEQARILVLEDDNIVRGFVESALQKMGHRVTVLAEGRKTVEAYRKAFDGGKGYHLAILDLTIPGGMSGQEVARQILEIDPEARLIVSSGYANNPIMSDYQKYGFRAQLKKPYPLSLLRETLQKILG